MLENANRASLRTIAMLLCLGMGIVGCGADPAAPSNAAPPIDPPAASGTNGESMPSAPAPENRTATVPATKEPSKSDTPPETHSPYVDKTAGFDLTIEKTRYRPSSDGDRFMLTADCLLQRELSTSGFYVMVIEGAQGNRREFGIDPSLRRKEATGKYSFVRTWPPAAFQPPLTIYAVKRDSQIPDPDQPFEAVSNRVEVRVSELASAQTAEKASSGRNRKPRPRAVIQEGGSEKPLRFVSAGYLTNSSASRLQTILVVQKTIPADAACIFVAEGADGSRHETRIRDSLYQKKVNDKYVLNTVWPTGKVSLPITARIERRDSRDGASRGPSESGIVSNQIEVSD
jgi:hypothetical protein